MGEPVSTATAPATGPRPLPKPLTQDEQAVLAEYRRWRAMQRPGKGLTVHVRACLSPDGSVDVYGAGGEGPAVPAA